VLACVAGSKLGKLKFDETIFNNLDGFKLNTHFGTDGLLKEAFA
jgi:hypothetical protein